MSETQFVKYCPACGHENLPLESFCAQCDFDLMHVASQPKHHAIEAATGTEEEHSSQALDDLRETATPVVISVAPDTCRLELLENPDLFFEIEAGQTVGRGVDADIILNGVPHLAYISRQHARFSRRKQQWFVQYVASGNFIKVDGETYDDSSLVALHDGSILTMSLTSFRVVLS